MLKVVLLVFVLGAVCVAAYPQYRPSYAPRPVIYPRPPSTPEEEDALNNRYGGKEEASNNPIIDKDQEIRVETLPREKQPFWYLNKQAIAQHINQSNVPTSTAGSANSGTAFRSQSFFF